MLPDFKTYLNETYWSGMNRRAQGVQKRKEDDANKLDCEELCEYLRNLYNVGYDFVYNFANIDGINIKIFENSVRYFRLLILDFNEPERLIALPNVPALKDSHLYEVINDKFKLIVATPKGFTDDKICIYPKDESTKIDNNFAISFIDFILDNLSPPFYTSLKRNK